MALLTYTAAALALLSTVSGAAVSYVSFSLSSSHFT
jgi:hypothetical protein